jgi:biotin transport system substrate-specific component
MNAKTDSTAVAARPFPATPLAAWVLPASGLRRALVGVALSTLFAGLTAVGANIVIPIEPVPITMQTLFVLLAGAAIGRGWGSLSQALYVGLGVLGLPLFAGGAHGFAALAGPTGGYLISFLVAPWVVSSLLRRSDRIGWQVLSFLAGKVVILGLGLAHLTLFYTHDPARALAVGVLPFLPGAVFKIAAAVSIHRSSQALARHYGPPAR